MGVFLVLLALYAPYSWILLLLHHKEEWLKLWIALPGVIPVELLGLVGASTDQIHSIMPISTVVVPFIPIFVVLNLPQRRKLIAGITLAISCVSSFIAYLIYLD